MRVRYKVKVILSIFICLAGCVLGSRKIPERLVYRQWPVTEKLLQICLDADVIVAGVFTNLVAYGTDEVNVHQYTATLVVGETLEGRPGRNDMTVYLKYYSPKLDPILPFKEHQPLLIFLQLSRPHQQDNLVIHVVDASAANRRRVLSTIEMARSMWTPQDGAIRSILRVEGRNFRESQRIGFNLLVKNCTDSPAILLPTEAGKQGNEVRVAVELRDKDTVFQNVFREAYSHEPTGPAVIEPWSQTQLFGEIYQYQAIGTFSVKAHFLIELHDVTREVFSNRVSFRIRKE